MNFLFVFHVHVHKALVHDDFFLFRVHDHAVLVLSRALLFQFRVLVHDGGSYCVLFLSLYASLWLVLQSEIEEDEKKKKQQQKKKMHKRSEIESEKSLCDIAKKNRKFQREE